MLEGTFMISNSSENASVISNSTIPVDIQDLALGLCLVSSCLSLIGGAAILMTYRYLSDVRSFTRYLLVCLTMADLLSAAGYLTGSVRYIVLERGHSSERTVNLEAMCIVQSGVTVFSNLASFCWTIVIAAHIYATVVCKSDRSTGVNWVTFYHLVAWAGPVTIAVTALGFNVLGEDTTFRPLPWCFLKGGLGHGKLLGWSFGISIFWELLTYLVTVILYMGVKLHLYRERRRVTSHHDVITVLSSEDKTFSYVWFVLYLLKVWGTVRIFIVAVNPDAYHELYWRNVLNILLYIQSFATSGQAFWNCVFFCIFDKRVRENVRALSWRRSFSKRAATLQTLESIEETNSNACTTEDDENTPLLRSNATHSRRYVESSTLG